jgi:hypothetical protein
MARPLDTKYTAQDRVCSSCGAPKRPWRKKFCSRACQVASRRGHAPPPAVDGCAWIELGDGKFTLVDAADVADVSGHTWSFSSGYAKAGIGRRPRALHLLLLRGDRDHEVDHINGNKLDNRRSNLRLATKQQNGVNRGPTKRSKTGFKGVQEHYDGSFVARFAGKYLGVFGTPEAAAAAYDAEVATTHGAFARSSSGRDLVVT